MVGRKVENPTQPDVSLLLYSATRFRLTIKHGIDTKLCNCKNPDFPVLEGFLHVGPFQLLCAFGVAVLSFASLHHLDLLLSAEPFCAVGVVWEIQKHYSGQQNVRQALENENPWSSRSVAFPFRHPGRNELTSPAAITANTIHMTDSICHQAAESPSHSR